MSSATGKNSQEPRSSELEPDTGSDVNLDTVGRNLEPDTEDEINLEKNQQYTNPGYRQKNLVKKVMAGAGVGSLALLSPVGGAAGLGGALVLDYCGDDEMYSVEKAKNVYTKLEEYTDSFNR
jgi:hypothetical protein